MAEPYAKRELQRDICVQGCCMYHNANHIDVNISVSL